MKHLFLCLAILTLLASCADNKKTHDLDKAEACLNEGNIEGARLNCYTLQDTADIDLWPSQLCRQAIIYARLAECSDKSDDMAVAAKFYSMAVQASPDSVSAYVLNLDVNDLSRIRMICDVNQALENPDEYLDVSEYECGDCHSDSICNNDSLQAV